PPSFQRLEAKQHSTPNHQKPLSKHPQLCSRYRSLCCRYSIPEFSPTINISSHKNSPPFALLNGSSIEI
ncbi:MAG: hypothetical protein ACI87M_000265, partial [Yoonia sp.]